VGAERDTTDMGAVGLERGDEASSMPVDHTGNGELRGTICNSQCYCDFLQRHFGDYRAAVLLRNGSVHLIVVQCEVKRILYKRNLSGSS